MVRLAAVALAALAVLPAAAQTPTEYSRTLAGDALVQVALAYLRNRDDGLADAARTAEEAVRFDPYNAAARALLVRLYDKFDRPGEAAEVAAAALVVDPTLTATARTLARLYREQGRTADAVGVLEAAAAKVPDDAAAVLRDLGRHYDVAGEPAKAADAYGRALKALRPDVPGRRGELGEALARAWLAAGRPDEAKGAADKARAAFAEDGDSYRAATAAKPLAEALLRLGRPDDAREVLDRYMATKPRDRAAYELQAAITLKADRPSAALAELEQAINDADSVFPELRVLYGEECLKAGERGRAAEAFEQVVQQRPGVAAYRGLFAAVGIDAVVPRVEEMVYQARLARDTKSQRPGMEGREKADPESIPHAWAMTAALGRDPAMARRFVTAGLAAIRGQRGDDRLETWRLFVQLAARGDFLADAEVQVRNKLFAMPQRSRLGGYVALMDLLTGQHKYKQAVDIAKSGLEDLNHDEFFNYYMALPLAKLGRADEALAAIQQAIDKAQPANKVLMDQRRVAVLLTLDRPAEAEAAALAMLAAYPGLYDRIATRKVLASAYTANHKLDLAELELRQVLELEPEEADAYNALGYALADRGRNLPEAERLIRQALELDRPAKADGLDEFGENPEYQDSLGWVLFRRGRWAEARRWFEHSLGYRRGSKEAATWDHLGDACVRMGDVPAARSAWAKALVLYKSDPTTVRNERGEEVRRKLARLASDPG